MFFVQLLVVFIDITRSQSIGGGVRDILRVTIGFQLIALPPQLLIRFLPKKVIHLFHSFSIFFLLLFLQYPFFMPILVFEYV